MTIIAIKGASKLGAIKGASKLGALKGASKLGAIKGASKLGALALLLLFSVSIPNFSWLYIDPKDPDGVFDYWCPLPCLYFQFQFQISVGFTLPPKIRTEFSIIGALSLAFIFSFNSKFQLALH